MEKGGGRKQKEKEGGRVGERERERERERDGSPIEVSSHKVIDLFLCFGVKILKLMHGTERLRKQTNMYIMIPRGH